MSYLFPDDGSDLVIGDVHLKHLLPSTFPRKRAIYRKNHKNIVRRKKVFFKLSCHFIDFRSDPEPYQNYTDPQHCQKEVDIRRITKIKKKGNEEIV